LGNTGYILPTLIMIKRAVGIWVAINIAYAQGMQTDRDPGIEEVICHLFEYLRIFSCSKRYKLHESMPIKHIHGSWVSWQLWSWWDLAKLCPKPLWLCSLPTIEYELWSDSLRSYSTLLTWWVIQFPLLQVGDL
jgi:hypothetical protein